MLEPLNSRSVLQYQKMMEQQAKPKEQVEAEKQERIAQAHSVHFICFLGANFVNFVKFCAFGNVGVKFAGKPQTNAK